jgi:hypothetical protein
MTPLIDAAHELLNLLAFIIPAPRGSAPPNFMARYRQAVADLREQIAAAEREIEDAAEHGRL